uniref:Ionotropic glutamate receptor L-glutamate and glycine-binding domain-containing protein n=1 Tax=Anopheles maculatus TaxID=74869 RepID=A0A182SVR1_9DIPT
MEKLAAYQSYLALPYPKVILRRGVSIGTPDETCLLVMYVDCSSQKAMFAALEKMMQEFTKIVRNGKYIVLVDDAYLPKGNVPISISLGSFFATYNIVYWGMTGLRQAEELQYTLFFASRVYYMTSPLTHGPVFEWNRGLLRNTTFEIYGQAVNAFPYTHSQGGGQFRGIDMSIFENVMERIGCLLQVLVVGKTEDTDSDIEQIMNRLHQMRLDVMLTRRDVKEGTLPVVYIPDFTYYCLVAPRYTQIDLTRSLLRPFSSDVWWFIVSCGVGIHLAKEVSKYDTAVRAFVRRLNLTAKPFLSFYRISFAIICFVLFESYLAKVTSYFLTYRFLPDAKTLDEFYATGIPIRLEHGSDRFLQFLEPRARDLIVARGVSSAECDEFSRACAHLDSFARASYVINENIDVDPVTGRKQSYIVPEMIANYNYLSYCFARGSTLTDLVAVYLQRMYETGLMRLYQRQYEQYLLPNNYAHVVAESSLQFAHLMSLWICVSVGWGLSVSVFAMELVLSWLVRMSRKGRTFRKVHRVIKKRGWHKQEGHS